MDDLRLLKDRAEELAQRGRWKQATELFEQAVAREPRDPRLMLRLAHARTKLGLPERAVEAYRSAARVFTELGQYPRARAALTAATCIAADARVLAADLERLDRAGAPFANGGLVVRGFGR